MIKEDYELINKYEANQVDMISLLNALNEDVVKKGKKYKWPKHDSLEFTDNMWYQHSRSIGGLPLKFLEEFFGMSESDALSFIRKHYDSLKKHNKESVGYKTELKIPNKAYSNDKAFFYLTHFRHIDKDVIRTFMNNDLIYEEDRTRNVLFVGKDNRGEVRHIHKRSTHESKFESLYNQSGSESEYSFNIIGKSKKLFVFEAPIDMLSYISLNKGNWGSYSYVALCGLGDNAIPRILNDYKYIKEIHLCLDNDLKGLEASHNIKEKLVNKGFTVHMSPSTFKDYNEDLKFSKGLPAESGFNEPAMKLYDDLLNEVLKDTLELREITYNEFSKSYSRFIYSYKENETVSKFTYKTLLETATLSSKLILQQFTHLEKDLSIDELKERLTEKNNYHIYINVNKNIQNMTYHLSQIYDLFKKRTFHSKEDKLHIIKHLMNFTNLLVYTHVFLLLNERKEENDRKIY